MEPTQKITQAPSTCNFSKQVTHSDITIPRSGVVTLSGYGIKAIVERGHLVLDDGVGTDRRHARLPRVAHRLRRLVVIGSDGIISLAALRWLADQDAAFVMLDRDGKVLSTSGPVHSSDAKLRRAQSAAIANGVGLQICKKLIEAKLDAQERLIEQRGNGHVARVIGEFRNRLCTAENADAVRVLEARAAVAYFGALRDIPVLWPKADVRRIPEHWMKVGNRHSPITGGPRLAITPVHAVLNYVFAIVQSETRLAVAALGLDPGLGLGLHTDTANRDSLALDVLEPVRPQVESWLLDWIANEPLRKADFFEMRNGNCRLMSELCAKLSETAPVWRKLVAPWAEYVARTLWQSTSSSKSGWRLATPLTQQHRREAKGQPSFPTIDAPKPERLCRGCGKTIKRNKSFCANCGLEVMRQSFDAGRKMAQLPEFRAKRSAAQKAHQDQIKRWNPADLPDWLTREFYIDRVQPALTKISKKRIREALAVSEPYSIYIQRGEIIPHKRHWKGLARLAGVEMIPS